MHFRPIAFIAGLIAFALSFFSSNASACLSLSGVQQSAHLSYDPFSPVTARAAITVEVSNRNNKRCDGAIAFFRPGKVEAKDIGGHSLSYGFQNGVGANLIANASHAGSLPLNGSLLSVLGIAPGETRTVSYYLVVPSGQVLPAGSYFDEVQFALYQNSGSSIVQDGNPAQLQVSLSVIATMSVNLAGGGHSTTLNFGPLSQGATRSVILQARSNERYRLTTTSENGGVLKLDPPSVDGIFWRVPYSIRINNGGELALSVDKKVEVQEPATSLAGTNIPVEVKIGDPNNQRSGIYKDVIVVSIDAAP